MYIQITNRCNMHCIHCGYGCTAVGYDMSFEVFKRSCNLACKHNLSELVIGGGEPTLHKEFWKFLSYAIDHSITRVGLVTNGTNTQDSLFLAEMAKEGLIWCALSVDKYHDLSKVSDKVIQAFKKDEGDKNDRRELRDVSKDNLPLSNIGRAKESHENGLLTQPVEDKCTYGGGPEIDPHGNIYHCGCKLTKYGTVFNPTMPKYYERIQFTCDVADKDWREWYNENIRMYP